MLVENPRDTERESKKTASQIEKTKTTATENLWD